MSKQQLQADLSDSREEVEEFATPEEVAAAEAAWDETLSSPESLSFLDSLIEKGLSEMNGKK